MIPLHLVQVSPMAHPLENAYLEAFDTYADALFRHARLRLSSRAQAVDLTQDTFIRAWDYLSSGGTIHHWKSFLYRTLNNLIIDEYRRSKADSLDALLESDPSGNAALVSTSTREEREAQLDTSLTIERVHAVLPQLSDNDRTIIVLRFLDGLSPKEIAEVIGASENATSVRIHRALGKLRLLCEPFA